MPKKMSAAAIAGGNCARLYKLNIIAKNISNIKSNITRFFVVSHNSISQSCLSAEMFNMLTRQHQLCKILGTYPQIGLSNDKSTVKYNIKRIQKIFAHNSADPSVKKILTDAANHFLTSADKPIFYIKNIINIRFLIMPSVALYKYNHNKEIKDNYRESSVLSKIKKYDTLHPLYQKIIKNSKQIQKKIISLLAKKIVIKGDIVSLTLEDLRYYIDYLDRLIYKHYAQGKRI